MGSRLFDRTSPQITVHSDIEQLHKPYYKHIKLLPSEHRNSPSSSKLY